MNKTRFTIATILATIGVCALLVCIYGPAVGDYRPNVPRKLLIAAVCFFACYKVMPKDYKPDKF